MRIKRGLFDHMTLQRKRGVSDAIVEGVCEASGPVTATVRRGGKAVRGFGRGVRIGSAAKGRFRGRLKGVPVGGPYDIELAVGDEGAKVRDVLVGDVWILAGQSNMQGIGLLSGAMKPDRSIRVFRMDDRWTVASDPLHDMHLAVDDVHIVLRGGRQEPEPDIGVGPGLPFAKEVLRRTGVPQGLLACAHGGTSMDQWSPKLKRLRGMSLYGAMIRRFVRNGSSVAGMVWYQGESDANVDACGAFTKKMAAFIRAVRRDLGDPKLPIATVQISRVVSWPASSGPCWNSVQDQQRRLADRIERLAVVPTIDLTMDDLIHISGRGHQRLGRRLAEAMCTLVGGRKAAAAPIVLKSVAVREPRVGMGEVHVRFANVVGELTAAGRPVGFALGTPAPESGDVFDVKLEGKTAVVRTTHTAANLAGMMLYYGPGCDPVCNVTDSADRSLPVFGPIPLGRPRAMGPFIRTLRVSEFLPAKGAIATLACPDTRRLAMTGRLFVRDFCDLSPEISARRPVDEYVVYACRFRCGEPMELRLELGYDGPVKAWIDRKAVICDPAGTNPAEPVDKAAAELSARTGEHEIIVALGTNRGAAWGVFLRLQRLDVATRLVKQGPTAHTMPELLG